MSAITATSGPQSVAGETPPGGGTAVQVTGLAPAVLPGTLERLKALSRARSFQVAILEPGEQEVWTLTLSGSYAAVHDYVRREHPGAVCEITLPGLAMSLHPRRAARRTFTRRS